MNTHHHHTGSNNHGDHTHTGEGSTVVDPVCGMQVDPVRTAHHAEHEGITHHFCSARCLERFVADPARYLTRHSDDVPAPTGTMYTCPMHPHVRQDGPGICPICGMALEPEMPGLDDEDNPELRDFCRRFWRSEEHTSELQSLMRISYAVFCLKKKKTCLHIKHRFMYE